MNPLLDLSARPVIAHRGASGYAPENTLPAFELAVRQGAEAFELDVRLTGDNVPVVIHDPTLERTTDGRGLVATQTLAQLSRLDAGARFSQDAGRTFPFRAAGVVIPTLTEVLRAFPEMPVLLDIKESLAQDAIRRVLLEERAVDRCVLASDDAAAVAVFSPGQFSRAACPREIAALFWGAIHYAIWGGGRGPSPSYRLLSVPARHRGIPVPTRTFLSAARRLGCPFHVWTVNDTFLARRLWRAGVAGIVTDLPDRIRAVR